ncbi:tyrosine-type recombinase/integrase, partial [Candidatus Woesearchaeota archaeon]|nr:tyrosine-type recombinase/integrase [Candidatus Woesearchaeota archaeon]
MPEEDIYGSKKRYKIFMSNIDDLTGLTSKIAKYYCKNKVNLQYFRQFGKIFDSRDTSYIRRLRLLGTLRMITFATTKDLKDCEREDINEIVAFSHTMNKSPKTKSDFIRDTKFMWKQLFPERDERGRIDEMITPYQVRHLSPRIDKSREVRRNDKLTFPEYERIVEYFSNDPKLQAYITLSVESLTRPQELCFTKISDVEINEDYAKIWISSHGKEGVKFLQCIDSFPYFIKWYSQHPFKGDKDSYLFFSNGVKDRPMTPDNMNKKLRFACKKLNIEKKITPYSLKRNGVTFSRLKGDSDVDIQHRAGWTSTKQLQTYDMSG